MRSRNSFALLALALWPAAAFAQGPTEPPVYLRFLRTSGRPDLPLIQSYAAAQAEVTVLAATSISGPTELNLETGAHILIGLYLPNLSYRPDQAVRTLPSTDSIFGDLIRARRAAFDAINLNRPEMAYRIISGAASGTYAEAMTEGGQSNRKLAADTVISRENTLLRIQPSLSRVPADFWAPPPQ